MPYVDRQISQVKKVGKLWDKELSTIIWDVEKFQVIIVKLV
jgi:hypothetical protein